MEDSIFYSMASVLLMFGFGALIFRTKSGRLKILVPAISSAGFFLCGLTLMITAPERAWVGLYVLLFALMDAYSAYGAKSWHKDA